MKKNITKQTDDKYFEVSYGTITEYNGPSVVVIPEKIKGEKINKIGSGAFAGKKLECVSIPNTVEYIDEFAFFDNKLSEVILPDNLVSFGEDAFGKNKGINVKVNLESKNFIINNNALLSKNGLIIHKFFGDDKEYFLDDIVSEIKDYAFTNTNIEIVHLTDRVSKIGSGAFDYYKLKSINLSSKNKNFKIENSALISKDGKIFFGLIGIHDNYVFKEGIEKINESACSFNTLERVDLPQSLLSIYNGAFHHNSISEVTLPKNIEYVNRYAFGFNNLDTLKVRGIKPAIEYKYLFEFTDNYQDNYPQFKYIDDVVITTKEPERNWGAYHERYNLPGVSEFQKLIVENNYYSVRQRLISGLIPINYKDVVDVTPLMCASEEGHYELVKLMIDLGADVNMENLWGNTALILASAYGFPNIVKLLIDCGANINSTNKWNESPLILASSENQYEVAKVLIDKGADQSIISVFGENALSYAIANNCSKIINALKDRK